MALTAGEIALINVALMRMGSSVPIVADSDTTNECRVAKLLYSTARDFVLSDYEWAFATRRVDMTSTKAASTNTLWAWQYDYPADCLKARRVLGAAASPRRDEIKPFQVINTGTALKILTNEDSATLEYTARVTDTTLFDAEFASALGWSLAAELCLPLRAEPEMAKGALDAYNIIRQRQDTPALREGHPETSISLVDGTTSTQLVLCNKALGRVGYKSLIASLTENTDAARLCSMFYGGAVATTLREFPWNWATKYAVLTASGVTPPSSWAYAYLVPADCIFAREIVTVGHRLIRNEQRIPFEIAWGTGGVNTLYTDQPSAELHYTTNSVAEAQFDDTFKDALVWLLAAEIGPSLGLAPKDAMLMRQSFRTVISIAQARSMNEGFDGQEPDCEFITARN